MTEKNINPSYLACPIRQVISRFGDKWSMLVLFTIHNSETGVLRFSELHQYMTDCSQKMLSATLKNLEQYNLVHREVYPVVPPRVEYSLTETGKSLMPTIVSLIDWAKLHFDDVVSNQLLQSFIISTKAIMFLLSSSESYYQPSSALLLMVNKPQINTLLYK